jgi:2-haloacid dehalogenase
VKNPILLVAFDLYGTLLNLDGLIAPLQAYTPMAEAVRDAWRQRQLQLANAASSSGRFVGFDRITLSALHEIAPRFHLKLDGIAQKRLLDVWAQLPTFDDVPIGLEAVNRRRLQIALMTNAVESTARNALEFAGIAKYFKYVFASDAVQTYKPQGQFYDQSSATGIAPASTLFVSSNDWDATGGRQAGFHTVFVSRHKSAFITKPEREIEDLTKLDEVLTDFGIAPA